LPGKSIEAAINFYRGEEIKSLPKLFKEHLLAKTYGWTIDYMRSLVEFEFERFVSLALISERLDNYDVMNAVSIASVGRSLRGQ